MLCSPSFYIHWPYSSFDTKVIKFCKRKLLPSGSKVLTSTRSSDNLGRTLQGLSLFLLQNSTRCIRIASYLLQRINQSWMGANGGKKAIAKTSFVIGQPISLRNFSEARKNAFSSTPNPRGMVFYPPFPSHLIA
ncbi:hypothetical protein AVEN_42336-1 [Araneus ventricosus]|uniref:Uncharacterized protein n=1 Tax=Araneus ventricosus TaxID=182803 RepID=A0A4Y2GS89_ARAVE|nr:hypothetical protein AVEN_42336-1 [Araneus ventricosus]